MKLVEIRDLDGPNLFALEPVIKLEIQIEPDEVLGVARQQYIAEHTNRYVGSDPRQAIASVIGALHEQIKIPPPMISTHEMDTPHHVSFCFPWQHRSRARGIARAAFDVVGSDQYIDRLSTHLIACIEDEHDQDEPDTPTWVADSERAIPSAAVTGTNGKTTTTRLLAHILRSAGKRVGWSSSSGVYIEGEMVIKGDYTGHGGARRVLTDTAIDCAVLETARGGILLRGLGYQSNDVGVFINVSEDHLDLHGVHTVETLARVKATVVRTTRPDGLVVLNADDPLVLAQREHVQAPVLLISQYPENPAVADHLADGGSCLILESGQVTLVSSDHREPIIPIDDVPLTYGGMARHMVENTLAACGAAIGMGVPLAEIATALKTFQPDRDHNAGRLNVFSLDDRTIVVDFAHNEIGLSFLLDFARQLKPEATRLTAVIGTAGDRKDSVFSGLGRLAGERADRVVIKANPSYLRGRTAEGIIGLITGGLEESNSSDKLHAVYQSEYDGVFGAIEASEPGEIIVTMCVEDYVSIMDELVRRGAVQPSGDA
jgi:cyanophycin synthetase